MNEKIDDVNRPKHYISHESGIEAIEITRYLIGDLSNAWKYAMRYEDKNSAKKDLKKLCWYLNDFYNNFIDENNLCNITINVPSKIIILMEKVINFEPVKEIKEIFIEIYNIIIEGGILNPSKFFERISNIEKYAETYQ